MSDISAELASLARLDDRLVSTRNESLGGVLKVMLPKLILLVNKDELRAHVMKMFGSLLKRIKNLPSNECEVPLSALFELIQRQHLPFACNFAMTFIDVAWETQESRVQEQVATSVLHSLLDWPLHSPQSNALLVYTLPLVPVLGESMRAYEAKGGGKSDELRGILGDFYIDVTLVRSDIVAGAAGSIQPGLSDAKVERLTNKNKEVLSSDLKAVKLAVIEQLASDSSIFHAWSGLLIAVTLAFDPDSTVAQQAAHKIAAYAANTEMTDAEAMQAMLSRLLRLCSGTRPMEDITTINMAGNPTTHTASRSPLREDVRAAMFRWLFKEAKSGLIHATKDILAIFIETFFVASAEGTAGRKIRSSLMGVAVELATSLDDTSFASHAKIFFKGSSAVLEAFSRTRAKGPGADTDDALVLRERCYKLIELIGRRCAIVVAENAKIIATLFKLLDHEDERLAPQLYSCLGVLRDVYQERAALLIGAKTEDREIKVTDDKEVDSMHVVGEGEEEDEGAKARDISEAIEMTPIASSLGHDDNESLKEVLGVAACSPEPKKRLAALQWAYAVFGWQPITLETLILLADDDSAETVKALCIKNFGELRAFISTPAEPGPESDNESVSVNPSSSSLSRDDVTVTILRLLHRPSLTLLDPRRTRARREVMLTAAVALQAWGRTSIAGGANSDDDDGGGAAAAAAGWSWSNGGPDVTASASFSSSSSNSRDTDLQKEKRDVSILALLPDIFASLRNFPRDSPSSSPSAQASALAMARLVRVLASCASGEKNPRSHNNDTGSNIVNTGDGIIKAVDAVEGLLCDWLASMDEAVGVQVADTLRIRCSHPSSDAAYFSSLHAKILKSLDAPTPAPTPAPRGRGVSLVTRRRMAKANGMRALGAIIVALERRLRHHHQHQHHDDGEHGALVMAGQGLLRSLFKELHNSLSSVLILPAGKLTKDLTKDLDVCSLAMAAVQVWTQVIEGGVFINRDMAAVHGLNRTPPADATTTTTTREGGGAGSITETLVHIVVAFRDLTARDVPSSPPPSSSSSSSSAASVSSSSGTGAGAATTSGAATDSGGADLGPGRINHLGSSSSSSSSNRGGRGGEEGVSMDDGGDGDGDGDSAKNQSSKRLELLEQVASYSVSALTSFCVYCHSSGGATPAFAVILWRLLASPGVFYDDGNRDLLRFSVGESLVRMSYLLDQEKSRAVATAVKEEEGKYIVPEQGESEEGIGASSEATTISVSDFQKEKRKREDAQHELLHSTFPAPIASLVKKASFVASDDSSASKRSRGTAAVLLLVLVKNIASLQQYQYQYQQRQGENGGSGGSGRLGYEAMLFLLDTILQLLKHGESFTQDMACMSLCHLHSQAKACYSQEREEDLVYGKSVADRISDEVVTALSRERRAAQTVGVTEGASASSSSSNQGNGNSNNNNNNNEDNNGAAATPDVEERRRREREQLETAAAAAARQVGMNIDEIRDTMQSAVDAAANGSAPPLPAWRRRDPDPGNFGVYSTAIKLAKKSGDATIVFGVLSLIRRHPSFGAAGSPTAEVFERYKPVIARIEPKRMQRLVPLLFVARFDPYDTVRDVMQSLWDILIPSGGSSLTALLQGRILKYLSGLLYSQVWRDRESACAALENFLVRRSWKQVRPRVALMWTGGLKVVDDVRDSTRMASLGFVKALSDQILRACNPLESSEMVVADCLDVIVPLVIEKGLVAPSPEGRGVSMGLLVNIVKTAKRHLGLWLPRLIGVCVECMSAMEPQTLQYMSFHTARLKMTEEELDKMRLEMVKNSPMQQALDGCLSSLHEEQIPEVVRHLTESLTHGVGMPSRAAAATSLSHVVEKFPAASLGGHINRAFGQISSLLLRNPRMQAGLRRTLLSCLGSVGRAAENVYMEESTHKLISAYHSLARDEREDGATAVAACLQVVVTRCGSKLLDHDIWTALLAIAYVGSQDGDEETRDMWQSVNGEALTQSGAGNKVTAIQRALSTVLAIVESYLQDQSWTRRVHGLLVLQDIIKSLPEQYQQGQGQKDSLAVLLSRHVVLPLLALIKPKIWTGQDIALETMTLMVSRCSTLMNVHTPKTSLLMRQGEGGDEGKDEGMRVEVMTSQILGRLDSTLSSSAPTPAPALEVGAGVRVLGIEGLVELLLHEAGRGPKAYRLAAAIALSSLPWKRISASAPALVVPRLHLFCAVVGVAPFAPKKKEDGASRGGADHENDDISADDRGPSEQQKIRKLTRPTYTKKTSSSLSLFGARYVAGTAPPPPPPPLSTTTANTISAAELEEGEIVALHDPLVRGSIVRISQAQTQAQTQAQAHGVIDTDTAQRAGVATPLSSLSTTITGTGASATMQVDPQETYAYAGAGEEEQGPSLVDVESEYQSAQEGAQERDRRLQALLAGPAGAGAASDDTDMAVDKEDEDESSSAAAAAAARTAPAIPQSSDPAFRVKFVESIASAWPTDKALRSFQSRHTDGQGQTQTQAQTQESFPSPKQLASAIVVWVSSTAMREDTWAMRRASLSVLESILLARDGPRGYTLGSGDEVTPEVDPGLGIVDSELLQMALAAVKTGADDAKHAKVRGAAYQALEAALVRAKVMLTAPDTGTGTGTGTSVPLVVLTEAACEAVRYVIRAAAAETHADLRRKASDLQTLWLALGPLLPRN